MKNVITAKDTCWEWYADTMELGYDKDKCGKWIYHFGIKGLDRIRKLCKKAVGNGYVRECKHTSENILMIQGHGIVCFYLEVDDIQTHHNILSFMMDNHLLSRNRGQYCDTEFILDSFTTTGIRPEKPTFLSDFVDLCTGQFLD